MSRPTLKNLCNIDLSTLTNHTYPDALLAIIDALKTKKSHLSDQLRTGYFDNDSTYENVSGLSNLIKYIDKAIASREADYLEIVQVPK